MITHEQLSDEDPSLAPFDPVDPSPTDTLAPRLSSRQAVLALVRDGAGVTRAQLAAHTGLSKSATAQVVSGLLAEGLVEEDPAPGRRSGTLTAVLPDALLGGVHLTHHGAVAAVADAAGRELARARTASVPLTDPAAALDAVDAALRDAVGQAGETMERLGAVAVAVPGPIDRRTGDVLFPSVLTAWDDVHPAAVLAERWGRRVSIGNDANLGAWGEMMRGAAQGIDDALYLEVSHGVGAGLILGGTVYQGGAGAAGEIGHVQVDPSGPLCRCGQNGCLEVVASSEVVAERLRLVHDEPRARELSEYDDPVSGRVLRQAGNALGRVLAEVAAALNPDVVVVGGDLAGVGSAYTDGVGEALRRHTQPLIAEQIRVLPAGLGHDSALVGCLVRAGQALIARELRLEAATGRSLSRSSRQ